MNRKLGASEHNRIWAKYMPNQSGRNYKFRIYKKEEVNEYPTRDIETVTWGSVKGELKVVSRIRKQSNTVGS